MRFLTLILALMMLAVPALAEVDDSAMVDDGLLRVLLRSLGEVSRLDAVVDGCYAVDGDAGLRLLDGAEVGLVAENGEVWLSVGGLRMNLGNEVVLTRHAEGGLEVGGRMYCGDLRLTAEGDELRPVLVIGVEDYLCGVVGCEMSDSFPIEALKAQAVAARTYAMGRKAASAGRDYDLVDTTADQVFRGFNAEYENVIAAVEATRGVVGVVGGGFAGCYYTASNGGWISAPEEVWGGGDGAIESKADPYDLENPRSLICEVYLTSDLSDCAALREMLECAAGAEVVSVLGVEVDGREVWFSLDVGGAEPVRVALDVYDQIKDGLHLGLNKGDYERCSVEAVEDGFRIQMRGFGHGVGMSQRGAQWMAAEYGMDWREILGFYYPGMALERIGWSGPELERFGEVVASRLNVRAEPSSAAEVLGTFEEGQVVSVSGRGKWIYARSGEIEGWVRTEYIDED